ncbi:tetratricopeptide repeat protein [Geomesophilobacter sediminis]|uniref:Tetratricopeptide repeat protein n=1 Tax=Geomesophilobacter sediminis TaxID=2798584 RepID=A0A8J7IWI2_9BACT|nr:hypothetical protein [Geomesophilobacter sediminis]MBJ6723872.1 hypothetical protein [Geomesophilobacter sediminis]
MVFSRFFKKDHRHYMAQGEKYLQAERYADARAAFSEAAERVGADAAEDARSIKERLGFACDRLAELNLHEGSRSLTAGDIMKAQEHFQLAINFAVDTQVREAAQKALREAAVAKPAQPAKKAEAAGHSCASSCSSCGPGHHDAPEEIPEPDLDDEDRFHIMVGPLPGDLPERYAAMGKEFAKAYLAIHDGDDATALPILEKMRLSGENDIVMYELALIMYRSRRGSESHYLVEQALRINPTNPLCHLARVQMAIDGGNFHLAVGHLKKMRELDVLADQALIMLGDLYIGSGDRQTAMEYLSQALDIQTVAKAAAEKLVPLLSEAGRTQEAQYLVKRYLKCSH